MPLLYDEKKRQANIAKHGVDLLEVAEFDFDTALEVTRFENGEYRNIALGYIYDVLHVLVYTMPQADTVRAISLRRATPKERRKYHE